MHGARGRNWDAPIQYDIDFRIMQEIIFYASEVLGGAQYSIYSYERNDFIIYETIMGRARFSIYSYERNHYIIVPQDISSVWEVPYRKQGRLSLF